MEIFFLWQWENGDKVTVKVGNDIIYEKTYTRVTYAGKHYCDGSTSFSGSNYDLKLPIGLNFTHVSDNMILSIEANSNGGTVENESIAISNLYIYVDTCFYTCSSCSGPAEN